jgi:hypothetical protein
MKLWKIFKKIKKIFKQIIKIQVKGSMDLSLLIIIFFILGFLLLMEIGQTITKRIQLEEKKMELSLLYKTKLGFLINKISIGILKKMAHKIDNYQEILTENEISKIITNYLNNQYDGIEANVYYHHPDKYPVFSYRDDNNMKSMMIYGWIEKSWIEININYKNKKYSYKIYLKDSMLYSDIME